MSSAPTTIAVNGAELRRRRMDALIEQRSFAKQARISQSYLSHIEIGRVERVSVGVFKRLMKALDVTDRQVLEAASAKRGAVA